MKALGKASSWSLRTPVSTLAHCLAVVVFICALSVVTSAYTLVLRNGRRVEIPATFTLTQNTITYEAAPTINVTLLLTVVDIAATERANNELAGSFLRHSQQNQDASVDIETRRAQVTVTNLDLEPARRARVQSELAYEKRRKELGLPTIEESRRRRAQEAAETATLIRERQLELDGTESYWRERAGALRTEIVTVDAEIGYLNSRLGEYDQSSLANQTFITGVYPIAPWGNRYRVWPRTYNRGAFGSSAFGSQVLGNVPFGGGGTRGQILINPGGQFRPARPITGLGYPFGFPGSIYPLGNVDQFVGDSSYERSRLEERLNDRMVTRAGLSARWLQLEDEARDAHVPQIWLEP